MSNNRAAFRLHLEEHPPCPTPAVFLDNRYHTKDVWLDKGDQLRL
jgi:hypothetical protein